MAGAGGYAAALRPARRRRASVGAGAAGAATLRRTGADPRAPPGHGGLGRCRSRNRFWAARFCGPAAGASQADPCVNVAAGEMRGSQGRSLVAG